jgi:uncharacterized MAPEG superfamily protein
MSLLTLLAWSLVLALANIVAAAVAKRLQEPPGWAAGSRDAPPPRYVGIAARLSRAQHNLMETLPLFAAAALACHAMGRDGPLADWGGMLYVGGRVVFLPVYASGVAMLRTVVWVVSTVGLCLVLWACLAPA